MRVLVCGSRDSRDHRKTYEVLDSLRPTPNLIISGGAPGVDQHAQGWAEANGIAGAVFPAAWNKFGRSAGPIRNGWMLTYGQPDLVIAMPGGRGTADMVRRAERAGIKVRMID